MGSLSRKARWRQGSIATIDNPHLRVECGNEENSYVFLTIQDGPKKIRIFVPRAQFSGYRKGQTVLYHVTADSRMVWNRPMGVLREILGTTELKGRMLGGEIVSITPARKLTEGVVIQIRPKGTASKTIEASVPYATEKNFKVGETILFTIGRNPRHKANCIPSCRVVKLG